MHFEYRIFNIECYATNEGTGFIGNATIWQAADDAQKSFTSSAPRAYPTRLQAIHAVRVLAEMCVDQRLILTSG
jgi:hypothetical protein